MKSPLIWSKALVFHIQASIDAPKQMIGKFSTNIWTIEAKIDEKYQGARRIKKKIHGIFFFVNVQTKRSQTERNEKKRNEGNRNRKDIDT